MDPTYPLVPFVNILSAVLTSLALLTTALGRSANAGVVMLGIWLLIVAIWLGVDTIVWAKHARDVAPAWCKIWAHIAIATDVGAPACSLVINRRLYNILYNPQPIGPSKRERMRALAFDLGLGVGLPLFIMTLISVIEPVKYVVEEEYGCSSTIFGSVLSILLVASWYVIFPALSIFFYCPKIVWKLYRHAKDMNELMIRSNVNRTRYFRGLAIGCLDCAIFLPTGAIYLVSDAKLLSNRFYPGSAPDRESWGASSIPAAVWRANMWSRLSVTASMWTNSVLALVFFAIFGLTADARATYGRMYFAVVRVFTRRTRTRRARDETSPPVHDADAFELGKKMKDDSTVTVSRIDIRASGGMSASEKEGVGVELEPSPRRVSRISTAEMDAARYAGSDDGVVMV